MKHYDKTKVERFYRYILNEYNRDLFIEQVTEVGTTDKTDGSFVQVGIRPLIDEGIFTEPNYASELTMAGRIIALGERDLLVKTLLKDKSIETIKIKEKDFTPSKLQELLESLNAKILVSVDMKASLLKDRDWMVHIDFVSGKMRFNSYYDVFPISSKVANSRIIILNELALVWIKQLFLNSITKKKEKLDIKIGNIKKNGKVDILIRSVNKMHYYKEYIKIIEII